MELSARLEAVARMVTQGNRVCDVGCDHGYIAIYLVRNGISPYVYAMDVNIGPLERAKEHIASYALNDKIETILSDGLMALSEKKADAMVCAGMGGRLVIKILTEGMEKVLEMKELILQPQSEIHLVRAFLRSQGFFIDKEDMVYEDGKYYPVMFAMNRERTDAAVLESAENEYGQTAEELCSAGFSESESKAACDWLGSQLIRQKSAVLKQFLKHTIENDRKVLAGMPQVSEKEEKTEKEQRIEARCREIRVRMSLSERVLAFMEESCKR